MMLFFFAGGLDTDEPWQGRWESGVLVECHGEQERKGQDETVGRTDIGQVGQRPRNTPFILCQKTISLFSSSTELLEIMV